MLKLHRRGEQVVAFPGQSNFSLQILKMAYLLSCEDHRKEREKYVKADGQMEVGRQIDRYTGQWSRV
jgi:hypothetical protein